jgi:hypothetical protein
LSLVLQEKYDFEQYICDIFNIMTRNKFYLNAKDRGICDKHNGVNTYHICPLSIFKSYQFEFNLAEVFNKNLINVLFVYKTKLGWILKPKNMYLK